MKKIILFVTITIATILLINQGIDMVTAKQNVIHDDVIGTVHELETPNKHKTETIHYLSTSPETGSDNQTQSMHYSDFVD